MSENLDVNEEEKTDATQVQKPNIVSKDSTSRCLRCYSVGHPFEKCPETRPNEIPVANVQRKICTFLKTFYESTTLEEVRVGLAKLEACTVDKICFTTPYQYLNSLNIHKKTLSEIGLSPHQILTYNITSSEESKQSTTSSLFPSPSEGVSNLFTKNLLLQYYEMCSRLDLCRENIMTLLKQTNQKPIATRTPTSEQKLEQKKNPMEEANPELVHDTEALVTVFNESLYSQTRITSRKTESFPCEEEQEHVKNPQIVTSPISSRLSDTTPYTGDTSSNCGIGALVEIHVPPIYRTVNLRGVSISFSSTNVLKLAKNYGVVIKMRRTRPMNLPFRPLTASEFSHIFIEYARIESCRTLLSLGSLVLGERRVDISMARSQIKDPKPSDAIVENGRIIQPYRLVSPTEEVSIVSSSNASTYSLVWKNMFLIGFTSPRQVVQFLMLSIIYVTTHSLRPHQTQLPNNITLLDFFIAHQKESFARSVANPLEVFLFHVGMSFIHYFDEEPSSVLSSVTAASKQYPEISHVGNDSSGAHLGCVTLALLLYRLNIRNELKKVLIPQTLRLPLISLQTMIDVNERMTWSQIVVKCAQKMWFSIM